MKSVKTVFTYSNRTFTDVTKLFPYDNSEWSVYKEVVTFERFYLVHMLFFIKWICGENFMLLLVSYLDL